MTDQGQPPAGPQGQPAPAQGQQAPAPQAGQAFNELISKKGFKSPDDVAKSYAELESTHTKKSEAWKRNQELLEAEGVQFDENGVIVIPQQGQPAGPYPVPGMPAQAPGYVPPAGVPPYGQYPPQADPFQKVNEDFFQNPAMTALGLFNQMYSAMEQDQIKASQVSENFFKSNPEGKQFESEVRQLMMTQPLKARTFPKSYENALLIVKGQRYNDAVRTAGEEAIKRMGEAGSANLNFGGGAPSSGGEGPKLTEEQEKVWAYYQKNQPGRFKDKAEFAKYSTPTAGR